MRLNWILGGFALSILQIINTGTVNPVSVCPVSVCIFTHCSPTTVYKDYTFKMAEVGRRASAPRTTRLRILLE